jgi:DNA-binding NarL/FixJ family response regulator
VSVRLLLVDDCGDDAGVRALAELLHEAGARIFLSSAVDENLLAGALMQSERPVEPRSMNGARVELTARQAEVLALLCEGLSNAEIGARLFIAAPTVKYHVAQLFAALDVTSRVRAARWAWDHDQASPLEGKGPPSRKGEPVALSLRPRGTTASAMP